LDAAAGLVEAGHQQRLRRDYGRVGVAGLLLRRGGSGGIVTAAAAGGERKRRQDGQRGEAARKQGQIRTTHSKATHQDTPKK
jgi:hypothetical protein